MKSTFIQGVVFAPWFLITLFMLPMLQLNQTTFSLFTHSFIYLIAIYWTTGQGTEDTETKGHISDLEQLTGSGPSHLWAVNLSVPITWNASPCPHLHLPRFCPCFNASFPLIQISPSSWSLLLPHLFLSPSWKKSIPLLKGYSTSPAFSEGYVSFSNKNYMFLKEGSVSVSPLHLKEHSIKFCANINYSVKFSWVNQYLRDGPCKWGLSKS